MTLTIGVRGDFKRQRHIDFSVVQGMNESDPQGTPEVHALAAPQNCFPLQSVRLVRAVGIEPTTSILTCRENACGKPS
jgi:hypothetical protein